MEDLLQLVISQALGAAIGFAGGVLLPAALLLLRKKAKETPNKVDDALVDAAIDAVNKQKG